MNFKIVEQASDDSKYEAFKDLYMNSDLTLVEIFKKVGISNGRGSRYANEVYDETGYRRRKTKAKILSKKENRRKIKHYSQKEEKFQVTKTIKNRSVYFGLYKDEEIASKVVNALKKVDWDKKELARIEKELCVRK